MDEFNDKGSVPDGEPAHESRLGSESELAMEKHSSQKRMSTIHETFFVITICMAQILALSGLGQGFGKPLTRCMEDVADVCLSTSVYRRRQLWGHK
jgi:hypothetical protein